MLFLLRRVFLRLSLSSSTASSSKSSRSTASGASVKRALRFASLKPAPQNPPVIRASTFEWTWNWDDNWSSLPSFEAAEEVAPVFPRYLAPRGCEGKEKEGWEEWEGVSPRSSALDLTLDRVMRLPYVMLDDELGQDPYLTHSDDEGEEEQRGTARVERVHSARRRSNTAPLLQKRSEHRGKRSIATSVSKPQAKPYVQYPAQTLACVYRRIHTTVLRYQCKLGTRWQRLDKNAKLFRVRVKVRLVVHVCELRTEEDSDERG